MKQDEMMGRLAAVYNALDTVLVSGYHNASSVAFCLKTLREIFAACQAEAPGDEQ